MTKKLANAAPFIWHPIETAPPNIDMLVAYDNKSVNFIEADSNHDYDWQPYDGKRERGIWKPTHWMRVEAPK
jgi:hypothetical protein